MTSALKICPVCSTEYPANERFCPRDGSALRAQGGSSTGSRRVDHRRAVSRHQEARRRRHGAGVSRRAREDGAEERGEGDEPGDGRQRRRDQPVQSRSGEREPDQPSERRRHLRLRRDAGRSDLPGDGVRRGRAADGHHQGARRVCRRCARARSRVRRPKGWRRARHGDRPPRSQAGQHHDRQGPRRGRPGEGRGLRHREGGGERQSEGDEDRDGRRDAGVHESRAAVRRPARRAERHLFAGRWSRSRC